MVLGALTGGIQGERWHGKLLARAVDPAFGPEAEERAAARKRLREAEVARLAAVDHVGRLTAANRAAAGPEAPPEPALAREPAATAPSGPATAVLNRSTRRSPMVARDATPPANGPVDPAEINGGNRRHHLLGRR
jgi:hypothetical protein